MKLQTQISNAQVQLAVLEALKSAGVPIHEPSMLDTKADAKAGRTADYPYLCLDTEEGKYADGVYNAACKTLTVMRQVTLDEFVNECIKFYEKKKHVVQLNENYVAEYTSGDTFVKVGCQLIPVSGVLQLADIITDSQSKK